MQIPINIPTGSIRDKEIEYTCILRLVIYMVHDYSLFGSTADFVIKKENLGFFTGFGHLQNVRDVGYKYHCRVRQSISTPSKSWMRK